jgi:hypothetical protein
MLEMIDKLLGYLNASESARAVAEAHAVTQIERVTLVEETVATMVGFCEPLFKVTALSPLLSTRAERRLAGRLRLALARSPANAIAPSPTNFAPPLHRSCVCVCVCSPLAPP